MPSGRGVIRITDEAVAATKRYMVVDLSDVAGYPHSDGDLVELLKTQVETVQAGVGIWRVKIGLVTENDGTNGSVYWFDFYKSPAAGSLTFENDLRDPVRGTGLPMAIVSDAPVNFRTLSFDLGDVNWKNDVANLTDALGNTDRSPSPGDIVAELEEVGGATTIDMYLRVDYRTR